MKVLLDKIQRKRIKQIQLVMLKQSYLCRKWLKEYDEFGQDPNSYLEFIDCARLFGWLDSDYTDLQKMVFKRFKLNMGNNKKFDWEELVESE